MTTTRHPFVALADLASRENWCWKIACTTCGHMNFRVAFKELIAGKHPDSDDWFVRNDNHQKVAKLQKEPGTRHLTLGDQRKLTEILKDLDVLEMRKVCKAPDWLGYLGLVLAHTEEAEATDRTLSQCVVPQLMALVDEGCECHKMLASVLASAGRYLRWQDLEAVEGALK